MEEKKEEVKQDRAIPELEADMKEYKEMYNSTFLYSWQLEKDLKNLRRRNEILSHQKVKALELVDLLDQENEMLKFDIEGLQDQVHRLIINLHNLENEPEEEEDEEKKINFLQKPLSAPKLWAKLKESSHKKRLQL